MLLFWNFATQEDTAAILSMRIIFTFSGHHVSGHHRVISLVNIFQITQICWIYSELNSVIDVLIGIGGPFVYKILSSDGTPVNVSLNAVHL